MIANTILYAFSRLNSRIGIKAKAKATEGKTQFRIQSTKLNSKLFNCKICALLKAIIAMRWSLMYDLASSVQIIKVYSKLQSSSVIEM